MIFLPHVFYWRSISAFRVQYIYFIGHLSNFCGSVKSGLRNGSVLDIPLRNRWLIDWERFDVETTAAACPVAVEFSVGTPDLLGETGGAVRNGGTKIHHPVATSPRNDLRLGVCIVQLSAATPSHEIRI